MLNALSTALATGLCLLVGFLPLRGQSQAVLGDRWTTERAAAWQQTNQWLVGCNFITSSAINQLEMWQADTFDLNKIDRELGWAEGIGFDSVRVFLHNLLWTNDSLGFQERMEQFLGVAARHHIKVMFVLFDSCC